MGKRKRKAFEEVRSDFPDEVELDQRPRPSNDTSRDDQPMHDADDATPPSPPAAPSPPRSSSSSLSHRYVTLHDFTSAVTSSDNSTVEVALTRFVSQVKAEYVEFKADPSPTPTTLRSPLLSTYLTASPEAVELFAVLGRSTTPYSLTGRALSALRLLLSPHLHPLSPPPLPTLPLLARRFLRLHLRSLYKLLHLSDTRLPLTALQLLYTIAALSPSLSRDLVHSFNLSHRAFLSLPSRSLPPSSSSSSPSLSPSLHLHRLRSAFIDLLLLLLSSPDPEVVAHTAAVPGLVQGVVRGLAKVEQGEEVRRVLMGVGVGGEGGRGLIGVMRAKGVGEEVKVGVITGPILDTLIRMWDGGVEGGGGAGEGLEGGEGEGEGGGRHAPVVSEFLHDLVGWVREEHRWSVAHRDFSRWKWHRALLTRTLSALHPSTSPAQRALLLSLLSSFPSLLPSYLTHLSVSFEPRLSTRWLANMTLLTSLLAVPLDPAHLRFLLSEATQPSQVARTLLSHLFPAALTRATLVQAVQHAEVGVRVVGCRMLATLLTRYASLMAIVDEAQLSTDGWPAWRVEVVDAVRKRLPDVQLVFQQRVKIWPAGAAAPMEEAKAAEVEGKKGEEEGEGKKEEGRVALYQAVLAALQAYDMHLPGAGQGIDMWKLLLIAPPSTQSTLALLHLLRRYDNSPRMFHVPQSVRSKDDDASLGPLRPVSYFGHLLALLVRSRTSGARPEGQQVQTEGMEVLVQVLVRTGLFGEGEGWMRRVREVVGWLEGVNEETVPYVEQLMGYVSSKVYAASAAASADSPLSPLLRAALSPAWPTSSPSSSSVIGLLCLVLSSLLSLSNPERVAVASAILHLPGLVAADDEAKRAEAKEAKEAEEEVDAVAVSRRNEPLVALLVDERFAAVLASAFRVLGATIKALKTPSEGRTPVADPIFHRLMKLSAVKWKDATVDLSQKAETDASTRQSLLLALAVGHKAPLLSLPRVRAALAVQGERSEEDERVVALVHSLPPSTLFLHASRQGVDLHFMPDGHAFTGLCEHWTEQARSEPQRLLLVMNLTHHLLALLQSASAVAHSPASIAVVRLLSTLRTLVMSPPTHTTQRLRAMLGCQQNGLRLIDFFLSSDPATQALSNEVTRALGTLVVALLQGGDAQQRALVDGLLQRLVDACVSLAGTSMPSLSSTLPLPLDLLQQLSSFLSREQLDRLSTAFISSTSASGAWWAVLCERVDLAQLLLASRPAEAFHLITRLSTESNTVTAAQRDALDDLLLQLLHPHSTSAASPSPAAVSARAYLVPESFFSAALQAPSGPRLRLVESLLQSTASPVYVHLFADHIHAHVNKRSPHTLLLSLLPSLRSYVVATAYLPSTLLPAQHKRVISLLSDMLEFFLLPALRRGEVEVSQSAEQVEGLVRVVLEADVPKVKARRSLLQALLAPEEDEADEEKGVHEQRRLQGKQLPLTSSTAAIACHLLSQPRISSRGEDSADVAEALSAHAATFLLRTLLTLTKLFKSPAQTEGFEEQLLRAVLQLLGDEVYLPTLTLPSRTSYSDHPPSSPSTLSHHARHLSYSALLASSTSAELSKLLTRCLTGALRSRFTSPSTHRLVFLLFNLQLIPDDRGEVKQALSISPSTLFRSTAPAPPDLSPIDKPLDGLLTAHTLFDLLVSHSQFLPTFLPPPATADEGSKAEAAAPALQLALLHLLYLLFVFPTSSAPTPPPSSLLTLLSSTYGGTHTPVDLTLFLLFRLLAPSSGSLLTPRMRWGEAGQQEMRRLIAGEAISTAPRLDDDAQWLFTAFNPQRLQLGPIVAVSALHLSPSTSSPSSADPDDVPQTLSSHYAVGFVLPFFLHLFKQTSPELKKLVDLGALSYTVLSLSHPHVAVRKAAYRLLNRFFTAMTALQAVDDATALQAQAKSDEVRQRQAGQSDDSGGGVLRRYHDPQRQRVMSTRASFREQAELMFLLTALRNAVTSEAMFVPATVTAFVSRAVYVVMHPQHRLYRAINRFIALRPALAMDDVPMFYAMLNSSSALDWRMHRSWILRMMVDGCSRVQDWHILRRRHVLPILMAFHDSRHADRFTRGMVIELIKRLACMGGEGEEALEGAEEGEGATGGPLAAMLRRHAVLVWLRMIIASEALTLHTLRPAMHLVLVIAREIHRRLPDEAPALEPMEQRTVDMEVDTADNDEDETVDEEDERMPSDDEEDDGVDDGVKEEKKGVERLNGHAGVVSSEDEEEEEEGEDEDSPADRAKAARKLSERRVAIAQDLQLLFTAVVKRTTDFVHQHQLISSAAHSTPIQPAKREEHAELLQLQEEAQPEHAEVERQGKSPDDDVRALSFGSPSSSLPSHVATLSQAMSLLHQLLLTSQKARKASGVDADPATPPSSIFSNHSYLDLVLAPTALSTLTESASLLRLSVQRDLFDAVTKARITAANADTADARGNDEALLLLQSAEWTWEVGVEGGDGRSVEQWLQWMLRALDVRPALASAVVDSNSLSQLLRLTFSALRPPSLLPAAADDRSSIATAHTRRLRLLNDLVLRLDRSLPPSRQLLQRVSHASLPSHLLRRLTTTTAEAKNGGGSEGRSTVDGTTATSEEGVEEEELALLLQDHWWMEEGGSHASVEHCAFPLRKRGAHTDGGERRKTTHRQTLPRQNGA